MDYPCICISLRKASRKMTALYDEALAPAGVNLAQFSLLRNVRRHGPVSLTRLGEITELDRSTLGRNVKVLERMGLVAASDDADHRKAAVGLTEGGRATLEQATPLWSGAQTRIGNRLGEAGRAQLDALLNAL